METSQRCFYLEHSATELRFRLATADYDPPMGRWLSVDPFKAIERQQHQQLLSSLASALADLTENGSLDTLVKADSGSTNRYWYAANNPVMATDPSGEFLGFGYGNYCGAGRIASCPPGTGKDRRVNKFPRRKVLA